MKVALLYFTGTYNTLYLTTLIKNKLIKLGHVVDVYLLNDKLKLNTSSYDMIGIGYPIHAFNAPKIVEQQIEKLNINNKKYFIYKNGGEPFNYNNASSYKLFKIMKKNKNDFYGEYHFLMPYNILFKTKEQFINYEMKYNLKYINYMCNNLTNDVKKEYKVSLFARFVRQIFKIQRLGCKINIKFYKVNKRKCLRCRKCTSSCPTNNIKYDKKLRKIVFKNKCVMCMRCSFCCPGNAISIGILEKKKIRNYYNFNNILSLNYNYDFNKEKERFYKKFKPYFDYIDSLVN